MATYDLSPNRLKPSRQKRNARFPSPANVPELSFNDEFRLSNCVSPSRFKDLLKPISAMPPHTKSFSSKVTEVRT
jgi:hypothetical protein